ncbi:bifunctional metallophosphatase/5'-nucleotidase [Hugenholtzia roseola]|uniref:bifunctional metallophosphatase/5'-nucleotidase n=1 Tax=Hugenholtzia roseola TaxID=1002 RepID=UPI0003F7F351|nr:bifunctional metallophosphatase/5'-nucleotidase [Hugenholtzia roseola]
MKLTFFLRKHVGLLTLLAALFLNACQAQKSATQTAEPTVTFLHINDVYEIAGVAAGKYGSLDRVATLKKELVKQNPNTFLILAGDFLNPSVLGTIEYQQGKFIKGKQMVETLNAAGLDFACFGNHEFDIKEDELLERINESDFEWIATNTFHKKDGKVQPFTRKGKPLPTHLVLELPQKNGKPLRMGLMGICLPYNNPPHSYFDDFYQSAEKMYDSLSKVSDFVVAITHLNEVEDLELARRLPHLPLIMGGHDHHNMYHQVGEVVMAKADANARTAYIHQLYFNDTTQKVRVVSKLKEIDATLPSDPNTKKVIDKWLDIAFLKMKEQGFEPNQIVTVVKEPLEAREAAIRNQQTNTGELITEAFKHVFPAADCALLGSGSVRIDDKVEGTITQYDILRMLPFGGAVVEVELKGSDLVRLLEAGMKNKGSGGYLQMDKNLTQKETQWLLKNEPIQAEKIYKVVLNDFILTGKERHMEFMSQENKAVILKTTLYAASSDPRSDVRKTLIQYLLQKTRE